LCASTTRYNDQTKGACGCGQSDPVPPNWWTMTKFTAALNCMNLDPSNPDRSWCPHNCGGCWELCTTGGGTNNRGGTPPGECIVVKVTNRCGDGYHRSSPDWCSQEMSYGECYNNPAECARNPRSTNIFGYPAHFDLEDFHGQVTNKLGWDNPEVTFEPVSCNRWQGPQWDCQCPSVAPSPSPGPKPTPTPRPSPRPSPTPHPIPAGGKCCWGGSSCATVTSCPHNSYCDQSSSNCAGNCGGTWCPNMNLV